MTTREVTRFVVRGNGDCSVTMAVVGRLDLRSVNALRHLLHELERDPVTLDLSECPAVTVDASRALSDACRAAEDNGGAIRIAPSAVASAVARRRLGTRPLRSYVDAPPPHVRA